MLVFSAGSSTSNPPRITAGSVRQAYLCTGSMYLLSMKPSALLQGRHAASINLLIHMSLLNSFWQWACQFERQCQGMAILLQPCNMKKHLSCVFLCALLMCVTTFHLCLCYCDHWRTTMPLIRKTGSSGGWGNQLRRTWGETKESGSANCS